METKNIYCIGDCLTIGLGVSKNYSYPMLLKNELGDNYNVEICGRTSIRAEHLSLYTSLFVYPIKNRLDTVIVWLGTNDLFLGETVRHTIKYIEHYINCIASKTDRVIILTILPRIDDNSARTEHLEEKRQLFNEVLRKSIPNNVLDLDKIKYLGTPMAHLNEKYYLKDKTHLNKAAYYKIAELAKLAIENL